MKYAETFHKCQFPLILALGALPLPYLLMTIRGWELLPYAWVFSAFYTLAALVSLAVPGKWRLAYGIAAALLSFVPWILSVRGLSLLIALIAASFFAVLLLWSLKIAGWSPRDEIPAYMGGICAAIQLSGQIILFFNASTGNAELIPYAWILKVSFFSFILLVMLSMNRSGLTGASEKRQRASASMRQQNTLLTMGLFGGAVLISFTPSLYRILKAILLWILKLLVNLFAFLSPGGGGPGGAEGGAQSAQPMAEAAEPSRLALILEAIAVVIAIIVVTLVAAVCLWKLGKRIAILLRRLWRKLERYAVSASEDYIDEITDTRDTADPEKAGTKKREKRLSSRDIRNLSPGERIRYHYLRLLLKHPQWKSGNTPRENLPTEIAILYERARYSNHPVTEADAEQFRSGTKRI